MNIIIITFIFVNFLFSLLYVHVYILNFCIYILFTDFGYIFSSFLSLKNFLLN